jgi:hypothetical protein
LLTLLALSSAWLRLIFSDGALEGRCLIWALSFDALVAALANWDDVREYVLSALVFGQQAVHL